MFTEPYGEEWLLVSVTIFLFSLVLIPVLFIPMFTFFWLYFLLNSNSAFVVQSQLCCCIFRCMKILSVSFWSLAVIWCLLIVLVAFSTWCMATSWDRPSFWAFPLFLCRVPCFLDTMSSPHSGLYSFGEAHLFLAT